MQVITNLKIKLEIFVDIYHDAFNWKYHDIIVIYTIDTFPRTLISKHHFRVRQQ